MSSQTLSRITDAQTTENGKARYTSVMLIDDNSLDNFINKKLIESNGFAERVTTCQEANEALEILKSAPRTEWPEVIFLDINMPVMDGFQFLEAFEKFPEDQRMQIKVIMLSTSESFKDLNRANKNPYVRKFLNKPLTIQVLQAINV
ncbi:MAG: response regulator [Bacteroidia bacterium]